MSISVNVNPIAGGTVSQSGTEVVTLTAIPATNYYFHKWVYTLEGSEFEDYASTLVIIPPEEDLEI